MAFRRLTNFLQGFTTFSLFKQVHFAVLSVNHDARIIIDKIVIWKIRQLNIVIFWPFDPAKNAVQGDAPEGSDTFQWQLGEEITWAEIGWWNGTS